MKRVKIINEAKQAKAPKGRPGAGVDKGRVEGNGEKKGLGGLREDDYTNSSTPFCDEKELGWDRDVNMEIIEAKEAFYDLRLEARNYLMTTKRLVQTSQVFCDENRKMLSYSLIESIKQPALDMSSQLNVLNSHIHLNESLSSRDSSFQDEIQRLQKNYEKLKSLQELKLEPEVVSQSCTSCEIF